MSTVQSDDFGASTDTLFLSPSQAEAIVRVVESAPHVRRRYQFFVWTQSQLQTLLPHQILVCAAYKRQRRELAFETFHSIVLGPEVLAHLTNGQGPLLRALVEAWIDGRGRPLMLETARLGLAGLEEPVAVLRTAGIEMLLVHGVSRPQRPAEIESFFVFSSPGRASPAPALAHLELMLPHLHTIWQRVMAAEHDIAPEEPAARTATRAGAATDGKKGVTGREREILDWVREGKSNQEIAEVLNISPLTVKNHVQKILRKLGANNRAHAVSEAISLGLLEGRNT